MLIENVFVNQIIWYSLLFCPLGYRCEAGYSGERCHLFTLAVGKEEQRYSRTTALAVMAVVLSLMCLTIIGILLALRSVFYKTFTHRNASNSLKGLQLSVHLFYRYHKKNDDNAESEEKVKLETVK